MALRYNIAIALATVISYVSWPQLALISHFKGVQLPHWLADTALIE